MKVLVILKNGGTYASNYQVMRDLCFNIREYRPNHVTCAAILENIRGMLLIFKEYGDLMVNYCVNMSRICA